MRTTSTCPKCHCKKLFVADDAQQPDQDSINGTHSLTVTCAYLPSGEKGFFGAPHQRYAAGTFEVWVCSRCGFTEWYAKNATKALEFLSGHARANVRLVDGDSPDGPFR